MACLLMMERDEGGYKVDYGEWGAAAAKRSQACLDRSSSDLEENKLWVSAERTNSAGTATGLKSMTGRVRLPRTQRNPLLLILLPRVLMFPSLLFSLHSPSPKACVFMLTIFC